MRDLRSWLQLRELLQRRDAGFLESLHLPVADARDEVEAVVVDALLLAAFGPGAHAALRAGRGVGLGGRGANGIAEALQQAAEVAGVFGAGEADLLARAEHHVHLVRLGLLHLGQQVAVEGELQHVRRLGVAPELGVDDFVAVVAEGGRLVHLAQEVRVTDEVAVQERGLIDDRRAGAQGGQRLGCALGGVLEGTDDLDDFARAGVQALQLREVRGLELAALAEEEFRVVVGLGALGLQRLVVQRRTVERAQVLALVEVHEVGSGEEEVGVAALHSSPYGRWRSIVRLAGGGLSG
jgi:hypothetical protein